MPPRRSADGPGVSPIAPYIFQKYARPLLGVALIATAFAAAPALAQGGPPDGRGNGPPPHAGGPGNQGQHMNPGNRGQHMGPGNRGQHMNPGAQGQHWGSDGMHQGQGSGWGDGPGNTQGIARTIGDIVRDILGYDPLELDAPAGGGLPPGLANRDGLPPGLARQLRETGSLPPGLQRQLEGRIADRTGYDAEIAGDTIRLIDPATGNIAQVLEGVLAFQRLLTGLDN